MNWPEEIRSSERWAAWLNKLLRACRSSEIVDSPDIRVSRSFRGASLELTAEATPQGGAFQWKGEWQDQAYKKDDVVIRGSANPSSAAHNDTFNILLNGAKAGVYIALKDVPAGTAAPKEPNTGTFWETLARFATPIFTVGVGPFASDTQTTSKIILNGTAPNGSINIQLADCNGKALTIREVGVCVDGIARHMMILGSAPY